MGRGRRKGKTRGPLGFVIELRKWCGLTEKGGLSDQDPHVVCIFVMSSSLLEQLACSVLGAVCPAGCQGTRPEEVHCVGRPQSGGGVIKSTYVIGSGWICQNVWCAGGRGEGSSTPQEGWGRGVVRGLSASGEACTGQAWEEFRMGHSVHGGPVGVRTAAPLEGHAVRRAYRAPEHGGGQDWLCGLRKVICKPGVQFSSLGQEDSSSSSEVRVKFLFVLFVKQGNCHDFKGVQ